MKAIVSEKVFNRGKCPQSFAEELIKWARCAPDSLFEVNAYADIYLKTKLELGPWRGLSHRKAAILEVLRVLAGFESSWKWSEGVDTSKAVINTKENAEAGAWQVSYDSRKLHSSLATFLRERNILSASQFQAAMKTNKPLAIEYVARLLRFNTLHNGPLYKGPERKIIRAPLRGEEHSIYPWLRRSCVDEFEACLK